jgi:phenylacetate-CoA ligase
MKYIKSRVKYFLRYNFIFQKILTQVLKDLEEDYAILSQRQNDRFIHIFNHAIKHSRFYQMLYADYGINCETIKTVDDIHQLPIINKESIRECINDVVIGNRFLKVKGYTSGTSGSPLVVYRDYRSILEEGAYIWAQRAQFGYSPGMKTVSLRGDLAKGELDRFDSAFNTLYLSSYNLNERNAPYYYEKISQFSPFALLAYPSSAEILATLFENINRSVNIPYTFTSSENLYDFQREKIHRVLGSSTQDWYGNAERTIALMQNQKNGYDELPTYSVNEYQADSTITTGLINTSFPLIRYRIDDIIVPERPRDSYKKKVTISRIDGRADDVLLLPDGTRIGRMDVVFKGIENIQFAQFEQFDPNSFQLNIVVNDRFSHDDNNKLTSKLVARVGDKINFKINRVDRTQIKLAKSGKYKLVLNHIR